MSDLRRGPALFDTGRCPTLYSRVSMSSSPPSGGEAWRMSISPCRGEPPASKLVVVKELRQELSQDADHVAMFFSEARLGARMAHAAVVQVFDVGKDGDRFFIAMEHLDGHALHQVLMKLGDGGLPLAMYLHLIAELLTGLHYAHELTDHDGTPLCIVHRDVSPHNVFVTYDGRAKLVDFGIAKGMDSVVDTREGMIKGKAAYMAPEQASGEAVDRRADVYSAGVMIWEAVTGTRLFRGQNDANIIGKLMSGDIPSPRTVRPDTPWQLEAICMRAMAFEPSARYPTADALRRDPDRRDQPRLASKRRKTGLALLMRDTFAIERRRLRETVSAKVRESRERRSDAFLANGQAARRRFAVPGDHAPRILDHDLRDLRDLRAPSEPPPSVQVQRVRARPRRSHRPPSGDAPATQEAPRRGRRVRRDRRARCTRRPPWRGSPRVAAKPWPRRPRVRQCTPARQL